LLNNINDDDVYAIQVLTATSSIEILLPAQPFLSQFEHLVI